MENELPESEVIVKVSYCPMCKNHIRAAVKHLMTKKTIQEFGREVVDYNLSVKEIPLLKFRKLQMNRCTCD